MLCRHSLRWECVVQSKAGLSQRVFSVQARSLCFSCSSKRLFAFPNSMNDISLWTVCGVATRVATFCDTSNPLLAWRFCEEVASGSPRRFASSCQMVERPLSLTGHPMIRLAIRRTSQQHPRKTKTFHFAPFWLECVMTLSSQVDPCRKPIGNVVITRKQSPGRVPGPWTHFSLARWFHAHALQQPRGTIVQMSAATLTQQFSSRNLHPHVVYQAQHGSAQSGGSFCGATVVGDAVAM